MLIQANTRQATDCCQKKGEKKEKKNWYCVNQLQGKGFSVLFLIFSFSVFFKSTEAITEIFNHSGYKNVATERNVLFAFEVLLKQTWPQKAQITVKRQYVKSGKPRVLFWLLVC